jgi:WhiB family transcriptional regulator, redox-sensing transcriptional regulator
MTAAHTKPLGQRRLSATVTPDRPHESASTSPCLADPDRWVEGGDDPELKALCRGCPRRWLCAKDALTTPGAEGVWSAVYIPSEGRRARNSALRQLRSLATYGGHNVGADHN